MTEAEFLPLFDQYRPMVYGLALSYTRSPQDAEDVCQEVFLTLLEKPPAPGKERPWLARVAVNRCRDLLTSPWRRRRENDDTALERLTFETPEEAGLFAALGALSPDSRALLHLRYYEGFTVAELARQFRTTARRSPPGSTGPNNNSGRSWRNSAMKKLYQRTFEQVLAQTCPPLNRVEEQRRALASRCSHTESEVTAMTTKPRRPIRILVAAAAVAAALTRAPLPPPARWAPSRCSPAERLHQPTA